VQTIKDLNGSPNGVNTGSAGLAAEQPPFTTGWAIAGMLALVAAGSTGAALAVRARRS
jgi:hypothetical protein